MSKFKMIISHKDKIRLDSEEKKDGQKVVVYNGMKIVITDKPVTGSDGKPMKGRTRFIVGIQTSGGSSLGVIGESDSEAQSVNMGKEWIDDNNKGRERPM